MAKKRITITIDEDIANRMKDVSLKLGISQAKIIESLIRKEIERLENEEPII